MKELPDEPRNRLGEPQYAAPSWILTQARQGGSVCIRKSSPMARRAAKIDANQPEVVEALRKAGASVQSLAAVGEGCPDLLVGYQGRNFLMEVKDGSKPPSERKLKPKQVTWQLAWAGQVVTVIGPLSALQAIGAPLP